MKYFLIGVVLLLSSCNPTAYNRGFEDCMRYFNSNTAYDKFTMKDMVDMCKRYAENRKYDQ